MKIGVLVAARMGSSRLPDKHLRPIGRQAALAWLIERIEDSFGAEIASGTVVPLLTTGALARNQPLAQLCEGRHTRMFYGDDDNVPRRHQQAAQAFGLHAMLAIDGDDLFCAPEAMRSVYDRLALGDGLVRTRGLPLGMNSWGYSRVTLDLALQKVDLSLLETGWGRIFEPFAATTIDLPCPHADEVRATLDYEPDLDFFTRGILEVPDWAALASVDFVAELRARGIAKLNIGLNEEYWANFTRNISSENTKAP